MIVEREWRLISEANYLRGLVVLPQARAGKMAHREVTMVNATGAAKGSERGPTRQRPFVRV